MHFDESHFTDVVPELSATLISNYPRTDIDMCMHRNTQSAIQRLMRILESFDGFSSDR